MYSKWTSHIQDQDQKSAFERQVWASKDVLDRLLSVLDEREQEIRQIEMNVSTYDKPNWDYRQAHYNGELANIRAIKTLINLDQQRKNT